MAGSSPNAAVLFDLDGVIVDSCEFHMQAWDQWARDFAVQHAPGYFHDMFGRRNDAIIGGLLPDITPSRLQELAAHKEELFRSLASGNVVALPGVVSLLQELDERGVPRAVVTSTPRANLDVILESLGMAERFHALVAEEDASRGKPDPEGFLVASHRVGVAPASCVVIEDAPAGLQGAAAAGMRSIGVTTTHTAAALTDATIVVDTLADDAVRQFILRRE